jgi:hypothetical protein
MSANENADVLVWLGFKKVAPEEVRPGEQFSVCAGPPEETPDEPRQPSGPPKRLPPLVEGQGFFFSLGIKLGTKDLIFITADDGTGQGYSLKCTRDTYIDLAQYGFTDAFEHVTTH